MFELDDLSDTKKQVDSIRSLTEGIVRALAYPHLYQGGKDERMPFYIVPAILTAWALVLLGKVLLNDDERLEPSIAGDGFTGD